MARSNARISHTFLPYTNGKPFIWISGGSANLKPETANTWSIGADIKPSFVPGLTLSATYYNIDFKNMIGVNINGFFGEFASLDPANASYFILNPTSDQVKQFSGGVPIDTYPSLEALYHDL